MSEVSDKVAKNGKGDLYRISVTDKKYKENYNKIFRKKDKNEFSRQH